jgi:protein-S-isoprenylcysteine O-methyltransferase Ste14
MSEGDAAESGPPVLTFPPVIYASFFAVGYITDRLLPIEIGYAGLRHYSGGLLCLLGVAIVAWSVARFIDARTHVDIRKPATTLVTDGPYRMSRNPMYLAATLLYAGVAITFAKPVTLALLVPCLWVMHWGVIAREEKYLEAKFGDQYRDFRSRVRRWV